MKHPKYYRRGLQGIVQLNVLCVAWILPLWIHTIIRMPTPNPTRSDANWSIISGKNLVVVSIPLSNCEGAIGGKGNKVHAWGCCSHPVTYWSNRYMRIIIFYYFTIAAQTYPFSSIHLWYFLETRNPCDCEDVYSSLTWNRMRTVERILLWSVYSPSLPNVQGCWLWILPSLNVYVTAQIFTKTKWIFDKLIRSSGTYICVASIAFICIWQG